MTLAFWCVLIAALMPIVFAGIAKAGADSYDNRNPRAWLSRQAGWRQRANWAQQNTIEAFPPFAAAVIIAHLAAAPQPAINGLAAAFILIRIAYGYCYIQDHHLARSLVWLAGLGCVIALFVVAALA